MCVDIVVLSMFKPITMYIRQGNFGNDVSILFEIKFARTM